MTKLMPTFFKKILLPSQKIFNVSQTFEMRRNPRERGDIDLEGVFFVCSLFGPGIKRGAIQRPFSDDGTVNLERSGTITHLHYAQYLQLGFS